MKTYAIALCILVCIIERCSCMGWVNCSDLAPCATKYPGSTHDELFNIDNIYNSRPSGLLLNLIIYVITLENFSIQFYPTAGTTPNYYEIVLDECSKVSYINQRGSDSIQYTILNSVNRGNIFNGVDASPVHITMQANGLMEVFVNRETTPILSYVIPNPDVIQYLGFLSQWCDVSKVYFNCETPPCTCSTSCASKGMCSCKKDDIINELDQLCRFMRNYKRP